MLKCLKVLKTRQNTPRTSDCIVEASHGAKIKMLVVDQAAEIKDFIARQVINHKQM